MKAWTLHEKDTSYLNELIIHHKVELSALEPQQPMLPQLNKESSSFPYPTQLSFSGYEKDVLFMNKGDGTFEELGSAAGVALPQDGRAVGAADLDHDGALDLVTRNLYSRPLVILHNQLGGRSVTVRLRGTVSNRFGIGARVRLGRQVQEMQCGTGYMYGNAPELHFGMTVDEEELKVTWPSRRETRHRIRAGQIITVNEDGQVEGIPYVPPRTRERRVVRTIRPGDRVGEWKEDGVRVIWNEKCDSCANKSDFAGAEFVTQPPPGTVHPSDPLYPVMYKVKDGRVVRKWVGQPPRGFMK